VGGLTFWDLLAFLLPTWLVKTLIYWIAFLLILVPLLWIWSRVEQVLGRGHQG
jgi:hypothetical protein